MLQNLLKKREEGFTIIEVMIVLAIAGLIMVIVFLAVPNLQRNSRNTSRRNDATNFLAAANEYSTNNNGTLPTADTQVEALVTLGYYTAAQATLSATCTAVAACPALASVASSSTMILATNAACGATATGVDGSISQALTYKNRSLAVIFAVETGGTNAQTQCIAS